MGQRNHKSINVSFSVMSTQSKHIVGKVKFEMLKWFLPVNIEP